MPLEALSPATVLRAFDELVVTVAWALGSTHLAETIAQNDNGGPLRLLEEAKRLRGERGLAVWGAHRDRAVAIVVAAYQEAVLRRALPPEARCRVMVALTTGDDAVAERPEG